MDEKWNIIRCNVPLQLTYRMKTYRAKKKGLIHYLMVIFLILPFVFYFSDTETFSKNPGIFLPLLPPYVLLIWAYQSTYYQVEGTTLKYRSAFLKGEIEIKSIKTILPGKTLRIGLKPALANKGLIITYGSKGEIYLAPESNEELMADLVRINANIKIMDQMEKV